MNYLVEVCLVALTLTSSITPSASVQSEAHPDQPLQKGISVELPVTSTAVPMPDADQEDASVVTVTDDGRLYFGVDPISSAALTEKVRGGLSKRTRQKLYIKADARTPYAKVRKVLEAVRIAGVEAPSLLTTQQDPSESGTLMAPKGLEVFVGPLLPSESKMIVLQVLNSGQPRPMLKVNNENIPWAALQSTLRQLFQNRSEKVVMVKAAEILPFADVVDVVDMCRSTDARVILVTLGE